MHTVFFNYILGTEKLATVITEKSPELLMEEGVIPKGAAYLVKPLPSDDLPEEEQLKYKEVEYAYFDNYQSPTDVIVDYSAVMISLIDEMRDHRNKLLETLDLLQQRALIKGKARLVQEMEIDKQKLRDCLDIDVSKYKCIADFKDYVPDIFFVDYKVKFEKRINA